MRLRFFAFVGGLGVSGSLVGRIPRRSVTSSRHSKKRLRCRSALYRHARLPMATNGGAYGSPETKPGKLRVTATNANRTIPRWREQTPINERAGEVAAGFSRVLSASARPV